MGKVIGSYNFLTATRNATSGTGFEGVTRQAQRNGRNWLQREPKLPMKWLVIGWLEVR